MIRIALIGHGYWGTQLARNIAALPSARLSLICDPSAESLRRSRIAFPEVATHENVEEALASPAIDAVVIATPAATHFQLVRKALRAGKHVLVEKPFATSTVDAERLLDESVRRRRVLMVDHTYVLNPAVRAMRDLLESGSLGSPIYYDSARLNLGLVRSDVNVIWDLAVHDLAILDHLIAAPPDSIQATGTSVGADTPAQAVWLTLKYPGGFLAQIHASWIAPGKVRRILLGGTERLLVFDELQPAPNLQLVDVAHVPGTAPGHRSATPAMRPIPVEPVEPLRLLVEQFAECIATGTEPECGPRAGARVVRWLEAADQSLRLGRPVSPDAASAAAA